MSRRAKLILVGIFIAVLLPGFLMLAMLGFANTAPGRHLVETLAGRLSGGQVALQGLSGRFPDALHLDRIELKDAAGSWGVGENVDLDWSPLRLLTGEIRIDRLAAARIELQRAPEPGTGAPSTGARLPLRLDLAQLRIARLELDPPIAGIAAALSLDGAARLDSFTQARISLAGERLDAEGRYRLSAMLGHGDVTARIEAQEPAHGLLAELAQLPDLGPLSITASLAGPRAAELAEIRMSAGPLRVSGQGTIDLAGETLDLTIAAKAPAMTPSPDIAWQSVAIDARVHGPFTRPDAEGQIDIEGAKAGDISLNRLSATLNGSGGALDVSATLAGLHGPGPAGALFQSAPLELSADARLDTPERPFHFTLAHPLFKASGQGAAGTTRNATVALDSAGARADRRRLWSRDAGPCRADSRSFRSGHGIDAPARRHRRRQRRHRSSAGTPGRCGEARSCRNLARTGHRHRSCRAERQDIAGRRRRRRERRQSVARLDPRACRSRRAPADPLRHAHREGTADGYAG